MIRCKTTQCKTILILAVASHVSIAQEWTRFRGPNGTGQSDATTVPTSWKPSDYNWTLDLPGIGHSSPVVWNDRLFIQSADPTSGTQYVLCVSTENGVLHWRREFPSSTYAIHARNSFASSTPAVDGDHVYVTWATPEGIKLFALNHAGDTVWSREDLGPYTSQHGYGSSPMLAGEMVILPNLQQASDRGAQTSSVSAFNRQTGETRWLTPRTSDVASYAVPCLRTRGDQHELILCNTTHGMFALDLDTGHEIWSVPDAFSMRTVSSPVLAGNIVFGSTGSGQGGNYVVAIDLDRHDVVYTIRQQAPYVPCVVTHEDLAFLWFDQGVVTCIDIATGTTHWSKRVGGNYSGSPVRVGGAIYCVAEDGQVVVIAASRNYHLWGKMPLGEDSRSTPAVANGTMFLRTYSKLFSIGRSS